MLKETGLRRSVRGERRPSSWPPVSVRLCGHPLLARDLTFQALPWGFSPAELLRRRCHSARQVGRRRRPTGGDVQAPTHPSLWLRVAGGASHSRPTYAARCPRSAPADVSTATTVACHWGRDVAGDTHTALNAPPGVTQRRFCSRSLGRIRPRGDGDGEVQFHDVLGREGPECQQTHAMAAPGPRRTEKGEEGAAYAVTTSARPFPLRD